MGTCGGDLQILNCVVFSFAFITVQIWCNSVIVIFPKWTWLSMTCWYIVHMSKFIKFWQISLITVTTKWLYLCIKNTATNKFVSICIWTGHKLKRNRYKICFFFSFYSCWTLKKLFLKMSISDRLQKWVSVSVKLGFLSFLYLYSG